MIRSLIMESIKGKIDLQKKDITTLKVDAIVNAANETLLGGGGVDGAIHRAAGRQLLEECRKLNGCQTGKAKITRGYNLPAKFVIHTVGPFGEHPKLLESCYKNSLDLLKEKNLRTIAFPCISTGIYHYPNQNAAEVAFETVYNWIKDNPGSIERVTFCLFLDDDEKIYKQLLKKYFPENDGSSVDGEGYRKRNQEKVKSDKTKQDKKGEKSGKSLLDCVPFLGSKKEKNPKGKETAPESHPGKATQSNKSVHTAVNKDSHHQAKIPVVHDKEADMENTKLKGENVKGNSKEQRMPDRGEEEMEDTSNQQKRVKDDARAGDGKPTDELQKPTELNDNSPESDKNDLGSDTKEKLESIDV